MSIIEATILAIVEGLTEFLPVSSTGHMIIASSLMGIAEAPFTKTFTVTIQSGAILSVVVLYWRRFLQSGDFYLKLFVAFLPAAIVGFVFNDYIDRLLDRVEVVGATLIIGGVVFLLIDRGFKENEASGSESITFRVALKIGLYQCIAMIPGVSRSAATIIGGVSEKLTKKAAAEFSFFLAVPTMAAATGYKLLKFYQAGGGFTPSEMTSLAVGNAVAFVVAMFAIKSFITFLTNHGFKVFGYYRIVAGIIILVLYMSGVKLSV